MGFANPRGKTGPAGAAERTPHAMYSVPRCTHARCCAAAQNGEPEDLGLGSGPWFGTLFDTCVYLCELIGVSYCCRMLEEYGRQPARVCELNPWNQKHYLQAQGQVGQSPVAE